MQKIIAKLYDEYLDRCQIDRAKMPADQHWEMKRAFFGAAGQVLIYMRDDVGAESEEKAAEVFQAMLDEVGVFWQIEVVTQDAEMAANPKPKPAPPAGDYIPYTGDWVGLLKQIIPYLQDLEKDNIHDPGVGLRRDENLTKVLQDANLIVAAADDMRKLEGSRPKSFASELTSLVNRYSKENGSNTPDYVLANFLQNSLAAFDLAVNQREGHPEPDLVTRIKNKLRNTTKEIMDEIECKTAQTLQAKQAPVLVVGLKFGSVHHPGQTYEIMYIERSSNKCNIEITNGERKWQDNGWYMPSLRDQFRAGEYYEIKTFAVFQNNSDAFRRWAKDVKGFTIDLLGHQTGIKLPDGVTAEAITAEWEAFEKAHRPHFQKGGVIPGQPGPWPESPHTLDEKGFFFYMKTGGIGWCRMYGGAPWFMAQTADGQWYTGKQVNQTEIWNAKASEVSAEEDAALRKTIPNE